MADRFVILHHVQKDGEHWDFMVEHAEVLWTWRLDNEPTDRSKLPMQAERIGDHRKAYLTYEGPISGDRGHVDRIDAGTVRCSVTSPDVFHLELAGGRLSGSLSLERVGNHWILRADPGA